MPIESFNPVSFFYLLLVKVCPKCIKKIVLSIEKGNFSQSFLKCKKYGGTITNDIGKLGTMIWIRNIVFAENKSKNNITGSTPLFSGTQPTQDPF